MARPPQSSDSPSASRWIGARPTPGATALLVTVIASYLVLLFLHEGTADWVKTHLALNPMEAIGRRPWQLVTSWLVQSGLGSAISDVFGVWIFATAVEQQVGRNKMLTLFGVGQLAGAVAIALLGRTLHLDVLVAGCAPGVIALVMGFGVLYGKAPLRVFGVAELKARTLAWLVIGLGFFVAVLNQNWLTVAGDATGVVVGWLMLGGVARVEIAYNKWRLKRLRRRYKVIPGGRSGTGDSSRRYLN